MMRSALVIVVAVAVAVGAARGVASLRSTSGVRVVAPPAACDPDGIHITYDTSYDRTLRAYAVPSARVTGIASTCAGATADVQLSAGGTQLAAATVPVSGAALVVQFIPPVAAERVTEVSVALSGGTSTGETTVEGTPDAPPAATTTTPTPTTPEPAGCVHGARVGTRGDDCILGGPRNDRILGGPGDDLLQGGRGDDRIAGGTGRDFVDGGAGNDRLYGGAGADLVTGGTGNDRIWGNAGNDRLVGGPGNDLVYGGPGYDTCTGGAGRDRFYGCERIVQP